MSIMDAAEVIYVETPPGIKRRIEKYLERKDREYNTISQFVIEAMKKELTRLGA